MKNIFTLLSVLFCMQVTGQIAVNGNGAALQVANNGPAEPVDPTLTVQTQHTIPAFRVSISTNYNSGDQLSYNVAVKPATVSASYNSGTLQFTGTATAAEYQALLRTVTFSTTSSNAISRTITFEAGHGGLNLYDGHLYKFVSGNYSWTTAKTNAESETLFGWQGYLTNITSAGENSFIFTNVGKGWIGASDAASEGIWKWMGGPENGVHFSTGNSAVSGRYASWNNGEPNNDASLEHYAENLHPNNGNWNDAQNGNSRGYLVEFGSYPANISVDIFHTRNITMIATQLSTTIPSTPYSLRAPAIVVDPAITIYTASNFTQGKATISGNFKAGDVLSYTGSLPGEFSGSFNSSTGVLSFSTTGTVTTSQWEALFRSVRFSSTSTVIGDRTVTFSLGNQVAFSNGHFYEYVSSAATWPSARTNAAGRTYLGLQGYLATITSQAENDFIKDKLSADAWIGLSDDHRYINDATGVNTFPDQGAAEGKWHWVTGPEKGSQVTTGNAPNGSSYPTAYMSAFNFWNVGEPNNWYDGSQYENVGEIYSTASNPGRWNDNRESLARGYVVEYGGLAGDPLLFLSANRTISITTVLPVVSLELKAANTAKGVELNWTTQAEVNTDYFSVQHSTDGRKFTTISKVKAAGDRSTPGAYEALHLTPAKGMNYYRVQLADKDGRLTYSKTVAVDAAAGATMKLVPSVASSFVTVHYSGAGSATTLTIYGMNGQAVMQTNLVQEQMQLSVAALAPGVYIAEISDGSRREKARFVKQ